MTEMVPKGTLVAAGFAGLLACSSSPVGAGASDAAGGEDHANGSDSAPSCGAVGSSCDDSGVDGSLDSSIGSDSGPPGISDGAADRVSDASGCDACFAQNCGSQLSTCLGAPGCVDALQCVVMTCGTPPNLACISGCSDAGVTEEQQVLELLDCATTACGTVCTGALGTLVDGG